MRFDGGVGRWLLALVLFLFCALAASDIATVMVDGLAQQRQQRQDAESECPVCVRVVRAARELGKARQEDAMTVLGSYCSLTTIDVSDQKFCYNTENVRGEISRLLKLGADEYRVCKKVRAMNPDFCKVMSQKTKKEGAHQNDRLVRGVIYE